MNKMTLSRMKFLTIRGVFLLLLLLVNATLLAQSGEYEKKLLSDVSREGFVEYAPSVSADGKLMIFEANWNGPWQLFETRMDQNGNWSPPVAIDKINQHGDPTDLIGGPNISYDGNTLYFFSSFKEGLGGEDIYYSVREEDGWSDPKNIGAPINTKGYEGFPSVSSDGNTLYFLRLSNTRRSVDYTGSCFTIYQSKRGRDGKWREPEPLPYPINTGCEKSPRIMADNKTLIFASVREGGVGDFDLYQSQLDENGDWSDPIPLSFVNTPQSDQFACISAAGDIMYFSAGENLYYVDIPEDFRQFINVTVQGTIRDEDRDEGLKVEIIVRDAETSNEMFRTSNASNGNYSIVLSAGRKYNVEMNRKGYSSALFYYDLSQLDEYREFQQHVNLFQTARLRIACLDIELLEPLAAEIVVSDYLTKRPISRHQSDAETGLAMIDIPVNQSYSISVQLKNFISTSFDLDLTGLVLYRDLEQDIELVPEKVNVQVNTADMGSKNKINARVRIRNKSRNEEIIVESNEMVSLRVGDRYEIEASTDKGYFFSSTTVEVGKEGITPSGTGSGSITGSRNALNFDLEKIEKNKNLALNDINFESNSALLSESSFEELRRVIELLSDNPALIVEIAAHTDDVGSAVYNMRLSEKRAQSVVDYLIENKIPMDRFVARGYGESDPLVPNTDEENRAKNRRVELKVLDLNN